MCSNIKYSITSDKIAGMIIAAATGDALGAPSEFKYNFKEMPYKGWIMYKPRLLIRMQGYHHGVIGQMYKLPCNLYILS